MPTTAGDLFRYVVLSLPALAILTQAFVSYGEDHKDLDREQFERSMRYLYGGLLVLILSGLLFGGALIQRALDSGDGAIVAGLAAILVSFLSILVALLYLNDFLPSSGPDRVESYFDAVRTADGSVFLVALPFAVLFVDTVVRTDQVSTAAYVSGGVVGVVAIAASVDPIDVYLYDNYEEQLQDILATHCATRDGQQQSINAECGEPDIVALCQAVEYAAAFGTVPEQIPRDELVDRLQACQDPETGLFSDPWGRVGANRGCAELPLSYAIGGYTPSRTSSKIPHPHPPATTSPRQRSLRRTRCALSACSPSWIRCPSATRPGRPVRGSTTTPPPAT